MEQDVTMYQGFADTYDRLMDEIPYDAWHAYILELLRENQIEDGIVVDLACGTTLYWKKTAGRAAQWHIPTIGNPL